MYIYICMCILLSHCMFWKVNDVIPIDRIAHPKHMRFGDEAHSADP